MSRVVKLYGVGGCCFVPKNPSAEFLVNKLCYSELSVQSGPRTLAYARPGLMKLIQKRNSAKPKTLSRLSF